MSKLTIAVSDERPHTGRRAAKCSSGRVWGLSVPVLRTWPIRSSRSCRSTSENASLLSFATFPLSQMHPWAEPAAEVAEFAGTHGKFWEMHDLLYENQQRSGQCPFFGINRCA